MKPLITFNTYDYIRPVYAYGNKSLLISYSVRTKSGCKILGVTNSSSDHPSTESANSSWINPIYSLNRLYSCMCCQMLVYETSTMDVAASFKVTTGTCNTTAIKSIEFSRRGE